MVNKAHQGILFPLLILLVIYVVLLSDNCDTFFGNVNFSGDGKVKMPLSPTIADAQQRPFGMGLDFSGGGVQLTESSLYPSTSSVSHSFSSSNLGQIQYDNSAMASFWTPHRSQMHLQSRRSQSREDLNSSLAEAHLVKG